MKLKISDWPQYSASDLARRDGGIAAAKMMANAAMTAPKAGGVDQIECAIVSGREEQDEVAHKVEGLADLNPKTKTWKHICRSEAEMARAADCILFIGNYRAGDSPFDLNCGICSGKPGCTRMYKEKTSKYGQIDSMDGKRERSRPMVDGPLCSVFVDDLGYAVGSALVIAKRLFVDSRPMMTVGVAGQKLHHCPRSEIVVALPVATLQKNPFVDIFPDYQFLTLDKAINQLRKNYVIARQVQFFSYRDWYPQKKAEKEG
jgi:uncharacterized ferredoxin-like protein